MEKKEVDFDVDYEEKENSVFKIKKPKKIWIPGNNYFRIFIEVFVVLIIITILFVLYNKEWFGFSEKPRNYFSILQNEDQYDCGDRFEEAENLRPVSLKDVDIKTKELNTIGNILKNEKIALTKEGVGLRDELNNILYRNKVSDYNSRLEEYTEELEKHKIEIEKYNQEAEGYYTFLKENCVLVK